MATKHTLRNRTFLRAITDRSVTDAMERAATLARGEKIEPRKRRTYKGGRTQLQQAADLYVVSQLAVQGFTISEMAEILGNSTTVVSSDLKKVTEVYKYRSAADVEEARGKHITMLDSAISDIWREWHRSKRDKEETVTEAERGSAKGDRGKITTKRRKNTGDPTYMFALTKAMERQSKLAGLDKPAEARLFIEQAQDALADIGSLLIEELGDKDPALVEKIMTRLAEKSLEGGG